MGRKIPNSLSYHHVTIDGAERDLAVIDSDNLDTKTLCSMPGEDLPHGGIVEWMGNHWLIVTRDANNEYTPKGQCGSVTTFYAGFLMKGKSWSIGALLKMAPNI